jgi:hypothetical protein
MTAHLHADTSSHRHADFVARLDFSKRVQGKCETLAARGEVYALPMPAEWIATLEALGYTVDLRYRRLDRRSRYALCTHRGCIPSGARGHAARVAAGHSRRHAEEDRTQRLSSFFL